ncbi:NAD(P)/FAD-dependent oxidoreductase [Butyrivibrio sp. YAB3001]|uniref:NAD(P)/FAD-dependent oxidoreductase n=1 Tax=Butyrivibrio sp. YAB3001 TaxID=1520812 RepID=UPI0008F63A70|nr:FAD-dependent monooxygenase [Butyrivibrio sp. YAB3001]SFD02736.1 hypothetical protein SAMN02910398_03826 [Butyrivibrio sp. YAB3001]
MIRINQIKIKDGREFPKTKEGLYAVLKKNCGKILRVSDTNIKEIEIIRHSIDARKKPDIYHIYMVDVSLSGLDENKVLKKCKDKNVSLADREEYSFEKQVDLKKTSSENLNSSAKNDKNIVIVGAGPAGLFAGLMLAEHGYKPIILERGADVDKRTEIVESFWKNGKLNTATNVQFGEGGAGTFSDGKLNTMVKDKDGRGRKALKIFVENGANEDILYESKPHIGTDILRTVVKNIRERIIAAGGEVRFLSQVTDILLDEGNNVCGVKVACSDGSEEKNIDEVISCSSVILAIGHSARDTFYMLKDKKVDMNPKPFAVGFRVEHPQEIINLSQYGMAQSDTLSPAPYKLTATTDEGRGVYSFCMCPGGFVVNASSEDGMLAVNGMSYSKRDGKNANSAIIITVDPKDFGSDDVLSGVEFQRKLEKKAYELGNGKIPVEYYGDFKKAIQNTECDNETGINNNNADGGSRKASESNSDSDRYASLYDELDQKKNTPNMCGDYVFADVHTILPDDLNRSFIQGMEKFGRVIKGYNSDGALVSGVESRTSSPVRINRDEKCESVNIHGLYPCGEGAGYAGGIMSAAMDGIKVAEYVAAGLS